MFVSVLRIDRLYNGCDQHTKLEDLRSIHESNMLSYRYYLSTILSDKLLTLMSLLIGDETFFLVCH